MIALRNNKMIMNVNNVSIKTRDIERQLKKAKKFNENSLNSFFYNQRIRRYKDLVMIELSFNKESKLLYRLYMVKFNNFSIYERYLELSNIKYGERLQVDKSILEKLFIPCFLVKKQKAEIKNELSEINKTASVKMDARMLGLMEPFSPTKPVCMKRKREMEDDNRIFKKPRTEYEKYISRLSRKLKLLRLNLKNNKDKGPKFWTLSDEIIIDCLEYDFNFAQTTGRTNDFVKDVNEYYNYIKEKHSYLEFTNMKNERVYGIRENNYIEEKKVSTLISQIKNAINQHCVDSMHYYIRYSAVNKKCVMIPKNERKIALFANNILRAEKWGRYNRKYCDMYRFKSGVKLDDETVQRRIDFINSA